MLHGKLGLDDDSNYSCLINYLKIAKSHQTKIIQTQMTLNQNYLFQRIDKVDESAAVSRIRDEKQNLRSPELDVLLARVQHQQVFSHLRKTFNGGKITS